MDNKKSKIIIEKKRDKLKNLIKRKKTFRNKEVLKVSQKLDVLINSYYEKGQ